MAIVTTSQNLTAVSYTAGEIIEIRNGATLTIDSTPATRPGTIQCITSGKLRIENSSTTTPIVLELENNTRDLRFEGNGVLEIRGAPMEIGTSSGSQMTFDFATLYSGVLTDITYVEVETAPSSGVYYPWHIANTTSRFYSLGLLNNGIGAAQTTTFSADCEVFFWNSDTRVLTSGDGTNGKLVPTGCKVRIPNILITNQDWQIDVCLIHAITSVGTPTGGTFTITLINRRTGTTIGTTGAIAFNATAATIDTAVEAVLGAGTITSSGGPLPTAVSLTLAGAYASTPIAMVVNSSVTGGTNSIVFSRENSVANQSLIDLTPSGTMDAEWCAFSNKFFMSVSSFSSVKCFNVGFGSAQTLVTNSNGFVDFNKVSSVYSPYTAPTANTISNISGSNSKINGWVITSSSAQTSSLISTIPNLIQCSDVRHIAYGERTSTSGTGLSFTTIASIPIVRLRCIGGRALFTNLANNVIAEPAFSDRAGTTTTLNATAGLQFLNCTNITIAYPSKASVAVARSSLFNTDAASSNITVVGGTINCDSNPLNIATHAGAGFILQNFTASNLRSAAISLDLPASFAATGIVARKVFVTGGATAPGVDSCQDGIYDLVGCDLTAFNAVNASVQNFVGGNFMNVGLTPTTGHVTFGAFGSGNGMALNGSSFTDQIGSVFLPTATDAVVITMPFAMHGITAFQNQWPRLTGETSNGASQVHRIVNDGGVTGGTFTLSIFDADNVLIGTTGNIAFNASTSTVDTAVEAVTGAGTVTVSGALATGYLITFTGQVRRVTANGTNLTGGTKAGTCEALCSFTRTVAGERHDDLEFAVRVPGTSWPSYQQLTPTNLSGAIAALSGYSAGGAGLEMRLQLTAPTTSNFTRLQQVSILTDIDPSLYTVTDSSITFNGPNPTDVIRIKRFSDNTTLYSFTGGGQQFLDVGANFQEEVYFVREDALGTVLMRSLPLTQKLAYGNLGQVDLFYGAEVQLAQSSDVVAIRQKVDAYLDATISSRLAAAGYTVPPTVSAIRTEIDTNSTKLDVAVSSRNAIAPDNAGITAIKAKTDNLPANPAAVSDIPTAVQVADTVLRRSTANVEASGTGDAISLKSLYGMVAQGVHNTQVSGTTLTVTRSDDATVLGTRTVTTDATAEPIVGIDSD